MKKTAVKVVALVATALLMLSGCAKNNPNIAATVGSDQITVASVDSVAKVIAANSPDSPTWGGWRAPVLQVMVVSRIGGLVKQQTGITITDAQREQVYASNTLYAALAKDEASKAFMADFADATLLLNNTSTQALFAKLAPTVPVEVNPIFGEWDATNVQLSGDTGSLSKTLS
jgi:hypothetical protein